jgi:hypothetical protein
MHPRVPLRSTLGYSRRLPPGGVRRLAIVLKAPVYTTEQLWKNLKVGVPIHVIR